ALLVDTSRYWFNYRHASNPLLLLPLLLNSPSFPDPSSSIGVWLGDDVACNERNAWKAGVTAEGRSGSSSGRSSGSSSGSSSTSSSSSSSASASASDINLQDLEQSLLLIPTTPPNNAINDDALGEQSASHLLRLLTGRSKLGSPVPFGGVVGPTPTATPPNLLLYLAGHGGDGFLKFGDVGEVSSEDLLSTLGEMKIKRLFNKALIIVDTCQAGTISNAWGDRKGEHARHITIICQQEKGFYEPPTEPIMKFLNLIMALMSVSSLKFEHLTMHRLSQNIKQASCTTLVCLTLLSSPVLADSSSSSPSSPASTLDSSIILAGRSGGRGGGRVSRGGGGRSMSRPSSSMRMNSGGGGGGGGMRVMPMPMMSPIGYGYGGGFGGGGLGSLATGYALGGGFNRQPTYVNAGGGGASLEVQKEVATSSAQLEVETAKVAELEARLANLEKLSKVTQ
ncbi:hypothetical protein ScalyP_jg6356, partial [Parmales sp. scaly parma]